MTGILVPFDGSKHALKALHVACDLAEKYTSKILLLYVIPNERSSLSETIKSDLEKSAHQVLSKAAAKANQRNVKFDILDFEYGDPALGILSANKRMKPSTIVMGCRGLSATEAESFGTASRTVFAQAECTCISVK